MSTVVDPNVQQAMVNLFADMGVQPVTLQSNLVAATQSADTIPPSVDISEIDVTTASGNTTISANGTAVDAVGGIVAGVNLSVDGGNSWSPATGTTSWTYNSRSYANASPSAFTIEAMTMDDSPPGCTAHENQS